MPKITKMRSPCERCRKRFKCTEICEKLARFLPSINKGSNKREISVDPARLEKFGKNIEIQGTDPDIVTGAWLRGKF